VTADQDAARAEKVTAVLIKRCRTVLTERCWAWDAWQAGRYQRGEISQRPGYTGNPFRPR
jgi:hypothetical protein